MGISILVTSVMGNKFHLSSVSLTVHIAYVTPPQELCQIMAWWSHQAIAMFT